MSRCDIREENVSLQESPSQDDLAPDRPASRHRAPRRGATAMEYLFVISLILVVAITGIGYFGQATKATVDKTNTAIQNAQQAK